MTKTAKSLQKREAYQPRVNQQGGFIGGIRDYSGRLRIIEGEVDFTGKRVLDLGCSGGFFTFAITHKAQSVTAVDADRHIIEKDVQTARALHHDNVEFLCKRITPEFLDTLPHYDVVLFLSVFHHMLCNTVSYPWNDHGKRSLHKLLAKIRKKGDVLVFEMGEADGYSRWSPRIKTITEGTRGWVPEHVFGEDCTQLKILAGTGYRRIPFRWLPRRLNQFAPRSDGVLNFVNRTLKRAVSYMLGVNWRDFRDIYVGYMR